MQEWDGHGGSCLQTVEPLLTKLEQRPDADAAGVLQGSLPNNSNITRNLPRGRAPPALMCQVPGCGASLAALREYYQRYRICELHRQMDQMVGRDGQLQRFCQQCGRFHHLSAFDDTKRSCRERLARHNERRRRRTAGEPSTAPVSNRSSEFLEASLATGLMGTNADSGSWAQNRMPELPISTGNASLGVWEQRQMQFQALQQELEQQALATAVEVQRRNSLQTSLAGPYVTMHSVMPASEFSGDFNAHYSQASTYEPSSANSDSLQLLRNTHLMPHILTTASDNVYLSGGRGLSPTHVAEPTVSASFAVSSQAIADARAQRKTMSWPLAQVRFDAATHEQLGLITAASGSGAFHVHQTTSAMPFATQHVDAAMAPTYFDGHLRGTGATLSAVQQPEIRVLGENQTLASIWETIMLVDDVGDH